MSAADQVRPSLAALVVEIDSLPICGQGKLRGKAMKYLRTLSAALLAAMFCSPTVFAAPMPGESFVVDGRCVTVTDVQNGQVSYEWREGNVRGNGSLPADWLGAHCNVGSARSPAAAQPTRQPANVPAQATNPDGTLRAPTGAPAETGFAQQILRVHNRYRCMHGVPPLQWSNDVAAYAQRWIEKAGYKHSNSYQTPLGPMGENLYWSSQPPSGADAAASWYDESQGYDYRREGSPGTGHFTAMIWKDVRYLGCGRVGGIVSCNYSTGAITKDCRVPNMLGCYVQQVLPLSKDAQFC